MLDDELMNELHNSSVIGRLLEEISWEGAGVRHYRSGGRGRENVLTAEVFLPLTYLPRAEFLGEVFRSAHGADEARLRVALELEQANIVFLPDESKLGRDGSVVQPDGLIVTPSCHVLVEAKAARGRFQPEQLAREYLVALQDAGEKAPILFLVLDRPPPVSVQGHGRLEVEEAVAVHLETVHARAAVRAQSTDDLMRRLPSVLAWTTWDEIRDVVGRESASYAHATQGPASTVRRLSEAVRTAIDWHTV